MDSFSISAWIRRAIALSVLAALFVIGCGSPPTGEISGVVTYNGELLPSGVVSFVAESGRNRDKVQLAGITSDGRYHIPRCLCGEVRISVQTPPAIRGRFAGASIPTIELPQQYADANISGLTYTVQPGPQTFDIKLTGPAARKVKVSVDPESSIELKGKQKAKRNP
jgi:hypothetical protein